MFRTYMDCIRDTDLELDLDQNYRDFKGTGTHRILSGSVTLVRLVKSY